MEPIPSVGRIVHYLSYGTPIRADGTQAFSSVCRAAIVTEVIDPETVKLCVLNPSGIFFDDEIYQDEGYNEPGSWHWPERV